MNVKKTNLLMCPPDYFKIAYSINAWMDPAIPSVDDLAKRQWNQLYDELTETMGIDVELLEPIPGLPDMVFTANAAFVFEKLAIMAHFKHVERQGEEPFCLAWFKNHGFETYTLPPGIFFEGAGDALIWRDWVFAGHKTRTDIASHPFIAENTPFQVLSLELTKPHFYHIDVCLCPLTDDYLIYAPDAFTDEGRQSLERIVPADKRIPVNLEEAKLFACNSVNIDKTIILNQGSVQLTEVLQSKGFQVVPLDLSEFLKAGGSAKCMTLRIG